jgi:hypothetical protein
MANQSDVVYKCIGDPKEVRSLYKIINANDKRKTSRVKNGFGTLWIGNIIDALGEDWEKLRCRGEIIGYHIENNLLTIYQSTAWCEQEGFRECIEKKFPSIKVYYREEEPGCDVYYTNDADRNYFPERYLLNNNDEPLYFNTIEEAAEYVSGIVNQKVEANMEAIEKALDNYEEEHEDDDVYFSFHEFQVVDD